MPSPPPKPRPVRRSSPTSKGGVGQGCTGADQAWGPRLGWAVAQP